MLTRILLLCFVLFFQFQVFSQDTLTKPPKIGLVLSGGGAKGLAHIGVIEALENAGIRPDYITGTSMGSIVGGLYALGYSTDQLKEIVYNTDWDRILNNQVELKTISYNEKDVYGRYIFEMGIQDGKKVLPKGVLEAQNLHLLLSYLSIPACQYDSFLDFPIPYACVATDIENGNPVVLNSGDLAEAMRASMAIPSVFSPVYIDSLMLVDGGLVRNFPVQEVLNMGADYVIGVNVSGGLDDQEDLSSVIEILTQSAFITSARDYDEQKQNCDLLVDIEMPYSTADFNSSDSIVKIGEDYGDLFYERFLKLKDSLGLGDPIFSEIKDIPQNWKIDSINIIGADNIDPEFIKAKISTEDTLTLETIEHRIRELYGMGSYDKIQYRFVQKNDKTYLELRITEAPPIRLKTAIHYDNENSGRLLLHLSMYDILLNGSRFLVELDLATTPKVLLNYIKYFSHLDNWALKYQLQQDSYNLPIGTDGNVNSILRDFQVNTYLGFQYLGIRNTAIMPFGGIDYAQVKPTVADSLLNQFLTIEEKGAFTGLLLDHDSRDTRYFTTEGTTIYAYGLYRFKANQYLKINKQKVDSLSINNADYWQVFFSGEKYVKLSPKSSIMGGFGFLYNNTANPIFTDGYTLGGFNPIYMNTRSFAGIEPQEYEVSNYFSGKLRYQYEAFKKLYLIGQVQYINVKFPFHTKVPNGLLNEGGHDNVSLSFQVGYQSFVGPIMLGIADDINQGNPQFYLSLGYFLNAKRF